MITAMYQLYVAIIMFVISSAGHFEYHVMKYSNPMQMNILFVPCGVYAEHIQGIYVCITCCTIWQSAIHS